MRTVSSVVMPPSVRSASAKKVATHRDDVARGFVGALGNPRAIGKSYNLASTEFLTWERYWEVVAEAIGAPRPLFVHIPTDRLVRTLPDMAEWCDINFQHNNVLSNDAARCDLGFEQRILWHEGAKALKDYDILPDPALVTRYEDLLADSNSGAGELASKAPGPETAHLVLTSLVL